MIKIELIRYSSSQWHGGGASICSIRSYPSLLSCPTKSALQSKNVMIWTACMNSCTSQGTGLS